MGLFVFIIHVIFLLSIHTKMADEEAAKQVCLVCVLDVRWMCAMVYMQCTRHMAMPCMSCMSMCVVSMLLLLLLLFFVESVAFCM